MGLGLAAVARPAYITTGRDALGAERTVDDLRRRSHDLLDAAYAAGVRYLDVARSYGRAEEFLSQWLAARPDAGDVVIGSKWGYRYVGDWQLDADVHEVKEHSVDAFAEQWPLTRGHLGERLAIYHVHSAMPDSPALVDPDLHRAMATLREGGVRVGISTSGPDQATAVRQALAVRVDGQPLFTSYESTWNLLETSAGPALAEAAAAGATVIVKEAVANGRLTPATDDPAPAAVAARAAADRHGVGVDAVATAVALAQPWAWRVLSGAVTVDQLTANLAAERVRLDEQELADLTGAPQPAEEYWAQRSDRPWA